MNWKFWTNKRAKPKIIPEAIGRKMVVDFKIDPDEVWSLKYVSRSLDDQPGVFEFRLFDPEEAKRSKIIVSDWASLDNYPELIQYTGQYDRNRKNINL